MTLFIWHVCDANVLMCMCVCARAYVYMYICVCMYACIFIEV